jgi:hypothetical protein
MKQDPLIPSPFKLKTKIIPQKIIPRESISSSGRNFLTEMRLRYTWSLNMKACGALNSCLESCKETIAFATQGLDHTRTTWCNLQESPGMRSLKSDFAVEEAHQKCQVSQKPKSKGLRKFKFERVWAVRWSLGIVRRSLRLRVEDVRLADWESALHETTWRGAKRQIARVRVWSKPWVIAKSQRSHFLYTTTPRWWSPGQANYTWPPQPLVGLIHSNCIRIPICFLDRYTLCTWKGLFTLDSV